MTDKARDDMNGELLMLIVEICRSDCELEDLETIRGFLESFPRKPFS